MAGTNVTFVQWVVNTTHLWWINLVKESTSAVALGGDRDLTVEVTWGC